MFSLSPDLRSQPNWKSAWCHSARRGFLGAIMLLGLCRLGAEEVNYQYDPAGRLISADYGRSGRIDYLYDPAGNLLNQTTTLITDTDADRMDDLWETLHFGNLDRSGLEDFDSDGQSDLSEYLAGTDPTDPGSSLHLNIPSVLGNLLFLEWTTVPGKTYQVQFKTSLTDPVWINLEAAVTATGPTISQFHEIPSNVPSRYYRVIVVR